MSDLSEFGPLVRHNGAGCSLSEGVVVWVRFEEKPGIFGSAVVLVCAENAPAWDWTRWQEPVAGHSGFRYVRILSYRVKRTRGMISLCEIAADPGHLIDDENAPSGRDLVSA
ncbi:hypothetical protein [Loktanella sp. 3ANDIMAR09]|uniref:hypothetical protein n=1 Tax=Loktanella sp. 3ANDIMAR09 TaxID=1225657 RepID=UPI000AAEFA0F|nr:hypothetical protein [Loktanella sp. 3ANDIMAR09]